MKKAIQIISLFLCIYFLLVGVLAEEISLSGSDNLHSTDDTTNADNSAPGFDDASDNDVETPSNSGAVYSIAVTGGAASVGEAQVLEASVGSTVTVSAGQSTTGREFYRWIVDAPNDLVLDDPSEITTTFVMPGANVVLRAIFILPETVMPVEEYVERLKDVAQNYKTLYVMGCFGAPMNAANKLRYINHHSFNADPERVAMINAATDDTFGFDCVCLLKGVLWGWNGDLDHPYGGASYAVNGVPDVSADGMFKLCTEPSTDFDEIEFGEALWMAGHIGLYIGDGLAVECTPKWDNQVQITACNRTVEGYNRRNWSNHGKLPFVDYAADSIAADRTVCEVTFLSYLQPDVAISETVYYGAPVSPKSPEIEGMVLIGWYTDEEFTSKYDFSSPVTGDMTLYAKWRRTTDPVDPDENNPTETLYALGDVDRDGFVNARDVTMIMKYLVGKSLKVFYPEQADVNGDGRLNAKDVTALMRILVGKSDDAGDTDTAAPDDTDEAQDSDTDSVDVETTVDPESTKDVDDSSSTAPDNVDGETSSDTDESSDADVSSDTTGSPDTEIEIPIRIN